MLNSIIKYVKYGLCLTVTANARPFSAVRGMGLLWLSSIPYLVRKHIDQNTIYKLNFSRMSKLFSVKISSSFQKLSGIWENSKGLINNPMKENNFIEQFKNLKKLILENNFL